MSNLGNIKIENQMRNYLESNGKVELYTLINQFLESYENDYTKVLAGIQNVATLSKEDCVVFATAKKVSTFKHLEEDDPILTPDPSRFLVFPIKYPSVWNMYKKHEASFWVAEEIVPELEDDIKHWATKMDVNQRNFIKTVLGFFAGSDGIVNENLCINFMSRVQIPEARFFYGFQGMMENIHAETYTLLIETLVTDPEERQNVMTMYQNNPAVAAKANWALKYLEDPNLSFHERLIAFAAVEGIFFSSSFCSIFWLKKKGLMPGLAFSNELISKDEGMHTDFACLLYSLLLNKLPKERVLQIILDAVEVESLFVAEALKVDMVGMNSKDMMQYVRFCADRLLVQLGLNKHYNVANPFAFMDLISLANKTNFFEKKVAEYSKAEVRVDSNSANTNNAVSFQLDEDF